VGSARRIHVEGFRPAPKGTPSLKKSASSDPAPEFKSHSKGKTTSVGGNRTLHYSQGSLPTQTPEEKEIDFRKQKNKRNLKIKKKKYKREFLASPDFVSYVLASLRVKGGTTGSRGEEKEMPGRRRLRKERSRSRVKKHRRNRLRRREKEEEGTKALDSARRNSLCL